MLAVVFVTGGFGPVLEAIAESKSGLDPSALTAWGSLPGSYSFAWVLLPTLGIMCQPQVLTRMMMLRDPREMPQLSIYATMTNMAVIPASVFENDGVYLRVWFDDGVNGYVTSPTPATLAERIGHLLDNPALAARLGAAGRQKTIRRYSWEQLAKKTEQAYTAVLHRL